MSWIDRCYEIYDINLDFIGNMEVGKTPLLPVAHTTQQVHVEVRIDGEGQFRGAKVLGPEEMTTIIPCTEESSARTSGLVPHPLVDKLQYVAGDYKKFGGEKESCWDKYISQLEKWCNSPYGNPEINAILNYLKKGTLIKDLVDEKILFVDGDRHLLKKWSGNKDDVPAIFKSIKSKGGQAEIFVRFVVNGDDVSKNSKVWDDFTKYYLTTLDERGYCYASGRETLLSSLSPYKIRNAGDRAKLISSNDNMNFTYRGRFLQAKDAFSKGFETTQKVHSVLRWLLGLQGKLISDGMLLVWGMNHERVPDITDDSLDFVKSVTNDGLSGWDDHEWEDDTAKTVDTRKTFAQAFNSTIAGYRKELTQESNLSVIILDAAVPGRMGIRYYRELSGSRLMDYLEEWHRTYSWRLTYRKETRGSGKKKNAYRHIMFEGTPAPEDIAKAAYGERIDEKLKKQTIERIVPCIVGGKLFPKDIIRAAVNRAVNGIGLESWEAQKVRQIACGLLRGYYKKRYREEFSMGVDDSINDRSYLFGRILACAEQVERYAQNLVNHGNADAKDKRSTNAERLMVPYTMHPISTLTVLQEKLRPYIDRIKADTGADASRYTEMLRLINRLGIKEYTNQKLGDTFLLGYASQKIEFNNESSKRQNVKE